MPVSKKNKKNGMELLAEKEIIEWLHETLGFGWSKEKIYKKRPAHHKRQWRWSCGYRDALRFAKLVWPYAQVKLHKLEQIIGRGLRNCSHKNLKPSERNVEIYQYASIISLENEFHDY